MDPQKALLIIDVQNDFCAGGALPVPGGGEVVPVINEYIHFFSGSAIPIFASRDWHPRVTKHFEQEGGGWPVHCVQNTYGAEFHPDMDLPPAGRIISKGMTPVEEGYSVFQGKDDNGEAFNTLLEKHHIGRLYVCGLATDYCVKHTVLDALREGYAATVLEDAVRGVNMKNGDADRAMKEMVKSGAETAVIGEIAKDFR